MRESIINLIHDILFEIAENNSDFVCECCLDVKDKVISLAGKIFGDEQAEECWNYYMECVEEFRKEEEEE